MSLLDEARAKREQQPRQEPQPAGSGSLIDQARARREPAPMPVSEQPVQQQAQQPTAQRVRQPVRQARERREQLLSAMSPEQRELIESISPLEAFAIGLGKGVTDIGRGLGLVDQATSDEVAAFERLSQVERVATPPGEVLGQAAPFLPLGVGAAAIPGTAARVGATAGLGAAEGGIIARGTGQDVGTQILSAGIGGTVAGALELGLPYIGRASGRLVRRITGRGPQGALVTPQGAPTPELQRVLDAEGISFDDLVSESVREMRLESLDPEKAARKAFLESQGLRGEAAPTRAQITRSVDDFSLQQQAMKSSGRLEERIAAQDRVLTTRFNDAIEETAGRPDLPVSSVTESVLRKASVLDNEIGRLYKEAREAAPGDQVVRFESLGKKIRELAPLNQRSGGNVRAIAETLQARGLVDDNLNPTGRIGVEETETQIRQLINSLYDESRSGGDIANNVLKEMKDALDDDVFRAAGEDLFQEARKAKFNFEDELKRAKISKFDKRKANLVRDMLENRDSVNPELFTDRVVFGKGWRSTDLEQLKDYITTESHGEAAWNDLKAEVLQKIKEKSFIGPEDANGFRSLSRDKIQKAINGIGDLKLNVIFTPDEVKFLKDIEKVAKFREPRKMTQQGFGPSAKAILGLEKKITDLPLFGQVWGLFDVDAAGRLSTRARAQKPIEGSIVKTTTGLAGAAAATGAIAQEENR